MPIDKISTGITGLDEILNGGLIPQKAYLLKGGPGCGKSTLGYHFLHEATKNGDKALYISLGESVDSIKNNAAKLGIDLSGVDFLDLSPSADLQANTGTYSVFSSAEVEQEPIIQSVIESIEKVKPTRVFLDSITMLRSITQDKFQLRNMTLSFIRFICEKGATLVVTSESMESQDDFDTPFWVDGILNLEYSPEWRKVSVSKYRGSDFLHGNHAFKISSNGMSVYPQLQPSKYVRKFSNKMISTGVEELDQMLNGGIEKGTISIITGPTGVGKTNFGLQFIKEAASRGERSALYSFEESAEVLVSRSESIGVPLRSMIENGNLMVKGIEPLSYSPDEFSRMVRKDVEENDTRIVVIDSIGGYSLSIREENILERLHALTVYLQNMGVTTILIHEASNITGQFETTGMNASYLADNIIFMKYVEMNSELRKVIGVLKKRLSDFERSIREFEITSSGLKVGDKISGIRGILSGTPEYVNHE